MAMISGLVRVMEKAARKAGGKLRRDFGEVEHLQVSRKGPADFVSKADQIAERTLYDELLAARPDWGFVLEEGGTIEGDPDKPRWIVDPLDGTSNFLHGIPHFAISIAVQEPKPGGGGWDPGRKPVYRALQHPNGRDRGTVDLTALSRAATAYAGGEAGRQL